MLAGIQQGNRLNQLAFSLFWAVFQQGLWVLMDGSLWPITALDVAQALELYEQSRASSWSYCPCPAPLEPQGQGLPVLPRKPRVTLVGGHNYVFDIALGLREASEADGGSGSTMHLLGYALAERFPVAAANCALLGPGFCQRDGLQQLSQRLCEPNEEATAHHVNLAEEPRRGAMSLAEARAEMRSVYANSTWLQEADVIICTFPYVLAFLLLEVVGDKPLLLLWQGGDISWSTCIQVCTPGASRSSTVSWRPGPSWS
ncbi:unnamed protein product [Effrenium voratum]|nr:unnamed protein product [Effrenium voratum]